MSEPLQGDDSSGSEYLAKKFGDQSKFGETPDTTSWEKETARPSDDIVPEGDGDLSQKRAVQQGANRGQQTTPENPSVLPEAPSAPRSSGNPRDAPMVQQPEPTTVDPNVNPRMNPDDSM